ncbi:hypothetical protein FDZ71_12350, partial [bacterium]
MRIPQFEYSKPYHKGQEKNKTMFKNSLCVFLAVSDCEKTTVREIQTAFRLHKPKNVKSGDNYLVYRGVVKKVVAHGVEDALGYVADLGPAR